MTEFHDVSGPAPSLRRALTMRARSLVAAVALAFLAPAAQAADFDKEWADLIAAAKKEGVVAIASGGAPSRNFQDIFEAFNKKFGVRVEVTRGDANATISRVLAERKTGKHTMDLALISFRIHNQRLVPAEALVPFAPLLIHPEVVDTSKWYGGRHWYGDKFGKYNFIYSAAVVDGLRLWYNTEKISPKEIESLKAPADLLDPKWKGKIAAHAMEDPAGIQQMIDAWQTDNMGPDWVKQFMTKSGVTFGSDRRIMETWLVGGRFPIKAPTGAEEELRTLAEKGMPIREKILFARTGMLDANGSGCCISAFTNAPHPNAAKLFANWFLTKEGQTIMHETIPNLAVSSLREDVPQGQVIDVQMRRADRPYTFPDAEPDAGEKDKEVQDEIVKIWEARQR
jgi:iron(III) transport system substrate-binding protein